MVQLTVAANRYSTVFVDDLAVGIEIGVVQEIVQYQTMTPVPLADPAVIGLINLRGQIVTAIDLRRRLGLPERAAGERPFNVIVHLDDRTVSLLVDDFGDVVTRSDPPDDVPQTLTGVARELISGVHQLEDRLLLVLDAASAIEVGEGSMAQAIDSSDDAVSARRDHSPFAVVR
ncbi:MAG TPA: chemotaxis protein CheW [Acidimicrobiales bacterium]|nr:chemotaxis protein CheW [Acidimicrobiales bacterium]